MAQEIKRWRKVLAQEPDEGQLVKDFDESPIANWEEFQQLIVRVLSLQFGAEVELVGSKLENEFGTPSNFAIAGALKFTSERPLAALKKYGKGPIKFKATITDGKLVEPIVLSI